MTLAVVSVSRACLQLFVMIGIQEMERPFMKAWFNFRQRGN